MELSLSTPALLFPAISLLLLAYTNRFLAIASLIRKLHSQYQEEHRETVLIQIRNLRRRIRLIRNMQALGIFGLFLCVFCMFLIFSGNRQAAQVIFGISLVSLMLSLGLSLYEIQISVKALEIQLEDIEDDSTLKTLKDKLRIKKQDP